MLLIPIFGTDAPVLLVTEFATDDPVLIDGIESPELGELNVLPRLLLYDLPDLP